jgi:predicted SAM-dependent methyltransferase
MEKIKLDVGAGDPSSGENQAEGYTLHDVQPYKGIDLVCDVFDLPKHLENGSCSKVRASHVIEHFGTKETQKVLKIFYDLLEVGGELEIIVPNFKWHAQLVMEGNERDAVYYAFGGQLDEWDFHKTGFTPDILFEELIKARFKDLEVSDESSITARAIK